MTKTEHIIGMMIEKAFEVIDVHLNLYEMDAKHANKEFRTIKLRLPRRTGQTTAVINVAKQYFKNPLYVCTEQMNDHVKRHINKNINMLTHTQIRNRRNLLGKSFDCVIIDNASFIDEGEIKETLENKDLEVMSLEYRHFLYILIG